MCGCVCRLSNRSEGEQVCFVPDSVGGVTYVQTPPPILSVWWSKGLYGYFQGIINLEHGMWSACAVQSLGEMGDVRNYRWGGPCAPAQTFKLTPQMRQLCHQTLISRGDSSVGGGRGTEGKNGKGREGGIDGKWGCFTAHWRCSPRPAVSAVSLMASRCYRELQWHHQVVTPVIRLYSGEYSTGVCNMSVLLYTCTAVIAEMYVWVGGREIAHSVPHAVKQRDYCVCTKASLTGTVGWVGPTEHHQEVSPTGYSVASWKKKNTPIIQL